MHICTRKMSESKENKSIGGKEFLAGSVAGATGMLVGHPLDTIKTRLQTTDVYRSALHCFSKTLKKEGWHSFYRGLSWPLMSRSVEQCIIFGLNEQFRQRLPYLKGDSLLVASGALAGASGMAMLIPVYVVKVQLQLPRSQSVKQFAGPLQCAAFNFKRYGLSGLYAGIQPSLIANPISFGVRFIAYEKSTEMVSSLLKSTRQACGYSERPNSEGDRVVSQMIAGGIAGMFTWASAYPLDVVMTKMQAQGANLAERPRGMLWHIADIYRKGGMGAFFKGIEPCLLRAFPVNAVMFITFEEMVKMLS